MQEEYDENGLLTVRREYTDRHVLNMEYRYTYDDAGILICCEEYIGGEHFNQKRTYSYREDGKLQEEKVYESDLESLRSVVEYLYDESGAPAEQWQHIYDDSGNIEKTSFRVYDATTENESGTIWVGEQRYSNGKVIYYYKSYPPYDDDYNEAGQITFAEEYVRNQNGETVAIYRKDAHGNLILTHRFEYNENAYIVRDYYQMPDGQITEENRIDYKDDGGWISYEYRNGVLIYSCECDKDGNILWQKNH